MATEMTVAMIAICQSLKPLAAANHMSTPVAIASTGCDG